MPSGQSLTGTDFKNSQGRAPYHSVDGSGSSMRMWRALHHSVDESGQGEKGTGRKNKKLKLGSNAVPPHGQANALTTELLGPGWSSAFGQRMGMCTSGWGEEQKALRRLDDLSSTETLITDLLVCCDLKGAFRGWLCVHTFTACFAGQRRGSIARTGMFGSTPAALAGPVHGCRLSVY